MAVSLFVEFAVLGYAILSRRFPKAMAGTREHPLNTLPSWHVPRAWVVGLILQPVAPDRNRLRTGALMSWAFGALWLVQLFGLLWFWSGRRLFR